MAVKPAERLTFTGRDATRAASSTVKRTFVWRVDVGPAAATEIRYVPGGTAAVDDTERRDGWPADTLGLENEYVSPDIAGEAERASVPENPLTPVVTRSNEADSPARAAAYNWTADTLKSGPAETFVGNVA
jgi:hypothetical protein